jgi:hypothetical protein
MKLRIIAGLVILASSAALAQTNGQATTSGPAANGTPAWHLAPSFPDPGGRALTDESGKVTVAARGGAGAGRGRGAAGGAGAGGAPGGGRALAAGAVPGCRNSTVCGRRGGFPRGELMRVNFDTMPGWTVDYSYHAPNGMGGMPAVALDSKGNLWAFQRRAEGEAQLMKFGPDHKLILSVGDNVIGHQVKAHGMAIDKDDNVWICDADSATIMKVSNDGKLLMTLGTKGHRGDWDEAKGQRLLWQPVMLAFGKNNDMYIAEGHANESPNDVGSDDPTNNIGASRIIHLTNDGKFINQWFGDEVGQGKFDSAHGFAIDPTNGDVWIGDREQYRIVVYTADGKFLRTMQMRNLVCAIEFDQQGNPWMGSGQDGQWLKLTRDGKVVGALGNGMGIGPGQVTEASYFVFDRQGNLYAGDTSVGRITVFRKPR